ncbi:hypothetical protein GCM10017653_44550 [Ancylobacter defluvii]|uniref:Collagen triple helix repeat protein n=2 Tax=Ancylobacter defluvii TaxID=1282440 RepID=A0A9W6JYS5_9HYPH|nr:hypothetical protein GCM10017653_44550 [Ancylobacter defluvii]
MNKILAYAFSSFVTISMATTSYAQQTEIKSTEMDDLSRASAIQDIKNSGDISEPLKIVTISGNRLFDGYYLQAERIVFKSGSTLTFSKKALASRNNLFLVAKEIVSEDAANPGTITYERAVNLPTPAMPGQAPTGRAGTHRQAGGQGLPGDQGVAGEPGSAAPALTITVLQMPGSGPIIDIRGGNGGNGGQGQKGGDGGSGGSGDNASQNCCNCVRGAENGYPGGQGGSGGPGGLGGPGGNGGTLTLLAPSEAVSVFLQKFRPLVSAAQPGGAGSGGPGGNGGPGGSGGADARPWCVGSGSQGGLGPIGPGGQPGTKGASGIDGDIFVAAISTEQFGKLYKTD